MKRLIRAAAFTLTICLLLGMFSACGLIKRLDEIEEEASYTYCEAGGTVSFPEGFTPTGSKNTIETVLMDTTLCGSFTQVPASKSTDYFYPSSDTLTVTANGTTDGVLEQFRINLWRRTETGTEWVKTLYFRTDGETATGTFTGLDTTSKYRISIAFSGATTSCTGSFNVSPIVAYTASSSSATEEE